MGSKASIPQNVRDYFATRGFKGSVKIVETFKPDRGWLPSPARHSLSKGRLLGLKALGITRLGLSVSRSGIADFGIVEMLGAKWSSGDVEPVSGPQTYNERDAYINGDPAYQSRGAKMLRAATFDAIASGAEPIIAQEAPTPEPECKCSRDPWGVRVLAPNCPRHASLANDAVTFNGFAKPSAEPAPELAAPAQEAPELMTAIPHAELTALLHFAQSASVLSAAIKETIPPAPEWGVTLTPTRAAMLRATAELIETRGDVAILQALRALGVAGIVDDYGPAIEAAQLRADAAHAASNAAIDAHYSAPGPQYTPRALTVANMLTGARAWAVTMRENHAHYGIESLIAGIDAVQARPSRLRLDADGAAFLPSMPIEK